ncbi:MAG: hypothetical protein R2807_01835 [Chitinophagales bacterium]
MSTFNITPSKPVGIIKDAIKDAILDGQIKNEFDAAYQLMLKKGMELGLSTTNKSTHEPSVHQHKYLIVIAVQLLLEKQALL